MKLSEAIRLGSLLFPQCFDRSTVLDPHTRQVVAGCAIWGAIESGWRLESYTDEVTLYQCPVPACSAPHYVIIGLVTHLNDYHRWTRDAIADHIERVESATEQESAHDTLLQTS